MTPASKFDITRRDNGATNASGIYDNVAPRGLALGSHSSDPTKFNLAQHNTFIGHLTRDVTLEGLSLADRVFGRTSSSPVGLEAPFKAGEPVSLEKAQEIEVEGVDYILTSGTGAMSTATTVPQSCSFLNGKLRISQSGEVVNYFLTANNLMPAEDGGLRMRFERA